MVTDEGNADWIGSLVGARLSAGRHTVVRTTVAIDEASVRTRLVHAISDAGIDAVVVAGTFEIAYRALAPLATEWLDVGLLARAAVCGSTIIIIAPDVPSVLAETLDIIGSKLEQFVRRSPPPIPTDSARRALTTHSLAVIGDLRAEADAPSIDLRATGRRGLYVLGALAGVCAAGVVMVGIEVNKRNQTFAPHSGLAAPSIAPVALAAPPPATPARAVVPAVQRRSPSPAVSGRAMPAKHEPPKPISPKPTPPARSGVEPAPIGSPDDACDEASCALHDNERECCTPFRNHIPPALDRGMVAVAIAPLRSKIVECGVSATAQGDVKIQIRVGSDGRVRSTAIVEAPEATIGACISGVLREATFPSTVTGGSFTYRYQLGDRSL